MGLQFKVYYGSKSQVTPAVPNNFNSYKIICSPSIIEQEITTEAPEVMENLQFFDLNQNVPNVKMLPRNLEALSDPIPIDGIPIAGRVFYTAYVS